MKVLSSAIFFAILLVLLFVFVNRDSSYSDDMDELSSSGDGSSQYEQQGGALNRSNKNFEDAITRIRRLAKGSPDDLSAYITALFQSDEEFALDVLDRYGEILPHTDHVTRAVYDFYRDIPILEGIERYSRLRESQPEVFELTTLDYTYQKADTSHPEKVLEFIQRPENEFLAYKRDVIIASQLTSKNPLGTLELIAGLEDQDLKYTMTESALLQWVIEDVTSATEYLADTEPSPWTDAAIVRLVNQHGADSPSEIRAWIEHVYDPEIKKDLEHTIEQIELEVAQAGAGE